MAEAIGVASGLVALASVALKSSVALYTTIKEYEHHPKRVRDLIEELEALSNVLRNLAQIADAVANLVILEVPLKRCGLACTKFEQELAKCLARSGGDRKTFRGWARLRYMGDDIDEFRQMLAGYKSTISIALAMVSLENSTVTIEKLESYRTLVTTTTSDLEDHLLRIDEKLETIISRNTAASSHDTPELLSFKEERLSTQKCLLICRQLSEHIHQVQANTRADLGSFSERITHEGLQECQTQLRATAVQLEKNLSDIIDQYVIKSKDGIVSDDDIKNMERLREEWTTVRRCIDFCSEADQTLKENISIIENYATGDDAIQYMVSTDGKTIHGKNRGFGSRPKQVGGHLNDVSLQQISKDIAQMYTETIQSAVSSAESAVGIDVDSPSDKDVSSNYHSRYGRGNRLEPKPPADTVRSSF
ncbi:hypothetical protein BKA67DRAFT_525579 [Truncatella angustata]|uniref:Azaphilone pigments biosynthesis cluster protein L N-terminal domain-containing protein n=1 Tax=Truncatella angustata TaxID=152316 RepID=A0A9P8UCY1_9PEZI|nr:uncharacterized protein BKA67DRAFT_525579 [Truncatella angustata]KAH6646820.1 hypothetical protein BKA67DRAFT_525579 [Truncatella angustata]